MNYICTFNKWKMKRSLFIIFTGLLVCHLAGAQVTFPGRSEYNPRESSEAESGPSHLLNRIQVNQDPRLDKMLKWHTDNNKKRDGISGYRVEIFFSSSFNAKDQALNKKKEFLAKYGEYNVHVKYTAPNFRVRVGDFRTKNEALKLLRRIQKDYPGAFVVPDTIDFPLLTPEEI
jgi:hypothetical protein